MKRNTSSPRRTRSIGRKAKLAVASTLLISSLSVNGMAMPVFLEEIWNAISSTFATSEIQAAETSMLLAPTAGSISIGGMGEAYAENFDTLVNSNTSDVVPNGWYFVETGSGANLTYQAGDGNGASGDTFSYGPNGLTERAFGSVYTNQVKPVFGAAFVNNTGGTITSLDIAFTLEEWRLGNAGRTDRTDFQYSSNATSLSTGTWLDKNELDLVTPNTVAPIGPKDGNLAENRAAISSSITGLNIPNGGTIWIRWVDSDCGGQNDGLAIDDMSITAQGTAPPNTTITSSPSSLTNSSAANFTFTSNDGAATFECSIDGSAFGACTSPYAASGLSAGAHSFSVRAMNISGTDASPASVSWTIDLTEPDTSISSAPTTYTSSPSATLAFSATDASAVAGYECNIDGAGYSACTSPLSLTGLAEGAHSVAVRATDAAGNVESSPASVDWTVDFTVPVVSDYTPLPDAPAGQPNTLTVDVTDAVSLASVSIHYIIGNQSYSAACSLLSGTTYSCTIPGQNNNTTVAYHVAATDSAGNSIENPVIGIPNAYTVGAGSVPPGQYKHFNPASGATLAGDVTVTGSVTLDGTLNTGNGKLTLGCNVNVNGAGSDKFIKGRVEKTVCATGTFVFPVGTQKSAPLAESFGATSASAVVSDEYTPLTVEITSGTFPSTLSVSVSDVAITGGSAIQSVKRTWSIIETGDVTANLSFSYLEGDVVGTETLFSVLKREGATTAAVSGGTVDAAANTFAVSAVSTFSDWSAGLVAETNEPASSIGSYSVSGVTSTTSNTISFSATDDTGVSHLECSLDNGAYGTCTSPISFTGLADGEHTLRVRAVDVVGNTESTPAAFSWTVDTAEPDSSITSGPASITKSTSATIGFTSTDVSAVTFQCSIDGEAFSSCTSPFAASGLGDGTHTVSVRGVDAAGNVESTPVDYTWTVDTTAPDTEINSTQSSLINSSSASFAFGGSDLNGVASYLCSLDGGAFAPCTSPQAYSGLADGDHTFVVKSVDAAGNTDPVGASSMWTVDTVDPDSSLTATPNALTNSTSASFTFSATDSSAVSGYLCSTDGGAFVSCASPMSLSGLSEGSHTFAVKAVDAAGNTESTPATYAWSIDATEPESSLTSTPTSLNNLTSATFSFSATDAAGISGFLCSVDGGSFAACSSPFGASGLGEGAHTFEVRAVDGAGNTENTGASYTWTVDLTSPETSVTSSVATVNNASSMTIGFSATDANGISSYACSTDGGSYVSCSSPYTWNGLTEGSHTFRVRATDAAGNVDASAAEVSWGTDVTAPDSSLTSTPDNLTNSKTAQFAFTATDSSSVTGFSCSMDGGPYSACNSPFTATGLADGSHSFSVVATDSAGNTETSPASWTWTVDATAPVSTFGSTPAAMTSNTSAAFTFNASDLSPISGFVCSRDGGAYAACSSPVNMAGLGEGVHTLAIKASDAAGNTEVAPVTYSWTVDLTGPQIAPFTPAPAAVTGQSRTVTVNVTDNFAVGSVSLHYSTGGADQVVACNPGGASFACTIPAQTDGTVVTYYLSGADAAGNEAVAPSDSLRNLYTVGAASIPAGSYSAVNPAAGSSLAGNVQVFGVLTLTGTLNAGTSTLGFECSGSVSGASSTNFVRGIVEKRFCSGATFTYPVGTVSSAANMAPGEEYSPVTVTATAGAFPSSLSVEASNTAVVGSAPTQRINRQWHIGETGDLTVDMTFHYLSSDVIGAEAMFNVIKRSGQTTAVVSGGSVDANLHKFSVTGVSTFSSWGAGLLVPLAAGVEVSGRVLNSQMQGINNVAVYITGGNLSEPMMVKTNQFGRYIFPDLEVGQAYVINVASKKFAFSNPQRFIQLFESLSDEDFVAEPLGGSR